MSGVSPKAELFCRLLVERFRFSFLDQLIYAGSDTSIAHTHDHPPTDVGELGKFFR